MATDKKETPVEMLPNKDNAPDATDKGKAPDKATAKTADETALIQLIAEGVGVDALTVIKLLGDNVDKIVEILKGGGMEGLAKAKDQPDTLSKEILTANSQIELLSKRIAVFEAREVAAAEAQKAAEKVALDAKISDHIEMLSKDGYLLPAWKDDAKELFAQDWARGERRYHAVKVVPIGERQAKTDPKTVLPQIDKLSKENQDAFALISKIRVHGKPLFTDDAAIVASLSEMDK
jgi:hypothetical protein